MLNVVRYWSMTQSSSVRLIMPRTTKLLPGVASQRTVTFRGVASLLVGILVTYATRVIKTLVMRFESRFDIIATSSHYPPDVLPAVFLRLRNPGSKLAVYVHGSFPEIPPQHNTVVRALSLLYNYFGILLAVRFSDLLFVFNSRTKLFIKSLGARDNRIVLSSNAVETCRIVRSADRMSYDACFLGRLVPSKGIFDLVDIWTEVCKARSDAKLLVIGTGLIEIVRQYALTRGVAENVVLTGHVAEERKMELLAESRVFLFPSYAEGWSIAVAEALSCGLPVVAYRLPIYNEVFGDHVITVPSGDIHAMAKEVILLLDHPDAASTMGIRGKEFVRKFDWNIVARREMSELSALLRNNKSNPHASLNVGARSLAANLL